MSGRLTDVRATARPAGPARERGGAVSSGNMKKSLGAGKAVGSVAFVGAGPGDEGLLTLRAVERLAEAEVVVLDQMPRDAMIRAHCRPGVEVLDAGFGEDGQ